MEQTLNQIALSVTDLRRSHQWYSDVFGFASAGGTESFKGYFAEKVQGVPGARSSCWWLIDRQAFFQLELFQFERPVTRPLPSDWSRADTGYSTIGIHVEDFDAALARAARFGTPALSSPIGEPGQRRVCLRDPDGILIELMEDDPRAPSASQRPRPRAGIASAVRFVSLTVPDLERSRAFFVDGMGLAIADELSLHGPEHEALWQLDGASSRTLLLWAGDLLLEIVQYLDPPGRPWPANYYISDQGLLNIAFGYRDRRSLGRARRAALEAGAQPNWMTLDLLNWGVCYVNDPQGFSLELLYVRPYWDRQMGFLPTEPDRRIERRLDIEADAATVWQHLVDHNQMARWWPCDSAQLLEPGEDGNGPGAVREIRSGRQRLVERVVDWEPGRRLDYRLLQGAPLRYHFGRVLLEAAADGRCALHYTIRFCPRIPGSAWLLERIIGGLLDKGLVRLKRLCENPPGETQ